MKLQFFPLIISPKFFEVVLFKIHSVNSILNARLFENSFGILQLLKKKELTVIEIVRFLFEFE
jgi:hypothetical protein